MIYTFEYNPSGKERLTNAMRDVLNNIRDETDFELKEKVKEAYNGQILSTCNELYSITDNIKDTEGSEYEELKEILKHIIDSALNRPGEYFEDPRVCVGMAYNKMFQKKDQYRSSLEELEEGVNLKEYNLRKIDMPVV